MTASTTDLEALSDEHLVRELAGGDDRALRHLYRRHAALVFTIASRVASPSAANDVVQDVFVTVWRKCDLFDAGRGTFRAWLGQVTRRLALNHARAARADGQHESVDSDALAADGLEADDALWAAHRRDALDKALASLPMRERRALSLAYFDELTQEQVARALGIPLGTAKTRIRLGLKRLAPAVMALLGLLTLVLLLVLWRRDEQVAELNGDALRLATSSDVTPVRLVAVAPTPPEAHGNYRARAGDSTAVLTVSHLPPLSDGLSYTAWIRHGETWTSLGSLDLRSDGSALRVMRDRSVSVSPDELRVTREPRPTSVPRGDTVLAWPRQR